MSAPALSVIGTAIGGYRILGPLGIGGNGAVYLAEHPLLGRRVAVKILHPRRAADEAAVARFFDDCEGARSLDHPAFAEILELTSVSTPAGRLPCVVSELLPGRSLAELLIDEGSLSPWRATVIAEQIAEAVAAAHAAGLVHGGLKPENVFVARARGLDEVKLLDLGVWRFQPARGTTEYLAPEQRLGVPASERSDVYALGALLHAMLTGQIPRTGAPARARPSIPASLAAITARAVENDPLDRFPTMAAMLAALADPSAYAESASAPAPAAAAAAAPALVPVPAAPPVSTAPASSRRRRRAGLLVATAVAVTVAALLAVNAVGHRQAPRPQAAAASPATLLVTSAAPGARVVLDGVDLGPPGVRVVLTSGKPIEITVRARGYYPFVRRLIPLGETHIEAVLLPRPVGPNLL